VNGIVEVRQYKFLQCLEFRRLSWLFAENRLGKLEPLRQKQCVQLPVGHLLVGDMVLQYDWGVLQRCCDEFIIDWQCLSIRLPVMQERCLLNELSIVYARTRSSSFMCAAERNAITSFLHARSERCCQHTKCLEFEK